jgi:hypothetical protein
MTGSSPKLESNSLPLAATILYHRKQIAEAMWGRLATCGRLAIGLPRPPEKLPAPMVVVCGLPLCGAGCRPGCHPAPQEPPPRLRMPRSVPVPNRSSMHPLSCLAPTPDLAVAIVANTA